MSKQDRNTDQDLPKPKRKPPSNGKPFVKGYDPRRNLKGRPKSFDELRKLFQEIASQEVEVPINGEKVKISRAAAIGIMMSADKKTMREFLEIAYGKVPVIAEIGVDEYRDVSPAEMEKIRKERWKIIASQVAEVAGEE